MNRLIKMTRSIVNSRILGNRREMSTNLLFYFLVVVAMLLAGRGAAENSPVINLGYPMEILGFYTEDEPPLPGSSAALNENAGNLTYIAPFYYRIKKGGGIEIFGDVPESQINKVVTGAHQKNVKVLALVHNLLYGRAGVGKQAAHGILKNTGTRRRFIEDILAVVKKAGFDGVNLDLEDIYYSDKNNFSALVREMKQSLPAGLVLTVCVPAETGEFIPGGWSRNFDYRSIGEWADRVVVMAYDEHGYSSGPGPIAAVGWVERVIDYTMANIPGEKVLLGVPAYGFDWNGDRPRPKYLSYQTAQQTAGDVGAVPVFNGTEGVPKFEYEKEDAKHEVWFEDAQSFQVKAELAKNRGLKGLAIWRLGMEDPGAWKYVNTEINVIK